MTLAPGQLGSLTSIGRFSSSTECSTDSASSAPSLQGPTNSSSSGVDCINVRQPEQTKSLTSTQLGTTPQMSQVAHINAQPSTGSRMTFSELARQKGIREWNNSQFDDRWLLHENEMWNVDARRSSVITMSPGCPPAQLSSWQAQLRAEAQVRAEAQIRAEARGQAQAQAQVAAAEAQLKREQEILENTIMFRRARTQRRQAVKEDVDQTYDSLAGYASLVGIGPPKANLKNPIDKSTE